MNYTEYDQIVRYLNIAAGSKYSYSDIKARFESEPASSYGENMARWIPDFSYAHQLLLESMAITQRRNWATLTSLCCQKTD